MGEFADWRPIHRDEWVPIELKLDEQDAPGCLAVKLLAGLRIMLNVFDIAVLEDARVEVDGFFGVAGKPKRRGDLRKRHWGDLPREGLPKLR